MSSSGPEQPLKTLSASLLKQSTTDLLQLAASLCQARFAVLRIDGRDAVVNTPGAPLDEEEELGARAAARNESLVLLDDAQLEGVGGIHFYAAVRLADAAGGVQGTLAVLDHHPRHLSEREKHLLLRIAEQITRSVRIEELFQLEQERELSRRLASLGRLAAQVAHEFNNVLMGIQPVVEVIRRRGVDDPRLLRLLDLVGSSISRGKRITTDILTFGHPAQVTSRSVNVQELIPQVAEELRPMLPEGIALEVNVPKEPKYVNADRAQLSQALINVALNARDAMHATGGTLTLGVNPSQRSEDPPPFIHFMVTDTGEGIAGETLPSIFEPFFTTRKSGTGLGLSVVFQIVAAHGGQISVDSEPGKGSTFHIFIPTVVDDVPFEAGGESPDLSY